MSDRPEPAAPEPADTTPQDPDTGAVGLLDLALTELRQRREELLGDIAQLEARREQINREIAGSFAGQSDGIARRLKGFQEYLVGALQDLAAAAEQMEPVVQPLVVQPPPSIRRRAASTPATPGRPPWPPPPPACSATMLT